VTAYFFIHGRHETFSWGQGTLGILWTLKNRGPDPPTPTSIIRAVVLLFFYNSMREQNNGALLQLQLAIGEAILRHGRLQMHQIRNYGALGKLVVNYTVSQKKSHKITEALLQIYVV